MWITDYMEDIESDLSVFHRVDDYMTMPAPRFFSLVPRLSAYAGVLQARAVEEQENGGARHVAPSGGASAPGAPSQATTVSNDVAFAELGDWVEYKKEEV